MKFPSIPFLLLIFYPLLISAKDETNIDKFYPSNIERQALESDSELTKTVVKPDSPIHHYKKSSYISFGDRMIKSKGVVIDESAASKSEESRRIEELQKPDPSLHEPSVHESEPIDFAVTEMASRQEYTTEMPVNTRHHWFYPSDPSQNASPAKRKSSSSGRSSSRTMHRSSSSSYSSPPVTSSYSSSYPPAPSFPAAPAFPSSSSPKPYEWSESKDKKEEEAPNKRQEDNEPMPSIPEATMPESAIKVKDGQAATRQYFYNSRWVPKAYAAQPMQPERKTHAYGSTGFGQETQQYNKVAERGDDVLLVFAHSIEIPLIVTSPQAFKSNNNERQTPVQLPARPVVNTAVPQFGYMSSPEQQDQGLRSRGLQRTGKQVPQSRRDSSQRWGAASSVLPAKSNGQLRMMPINYPVMGRSPFAYPFADMTTAASAPMIQVTPANIQANHYLSRHHYPSYIAGRQNTRPMASERLVRYLPIN